MRSVGIIGGGSWATALVNVVSQTRHHVNWWVRRSETADYIKSHHRNPRYLPDLSLSRSVEVTHHLSSVVKDSEALIFAVPSAYLARTLEESLSPKHLQGKTVVSAIKGMEPGSNLTITRYFRDHWKTAPALTGVISGPCHAEEVAQGKTSFLTVAFPERREAEKISHALQTASLITELSEDVQGIEYAAVMKNIIAVGAGIFHGLGYGDNLTAVLISRSAMEIKRFLTAAVPAPRDMENTAYLGDLLVTCYSQFSRNRTFGAMIGKGYSVKNAQLEMNMVAEGYYAARCIHEINRKIKCPLPVCETVYRILYENKNSRSASEELVQKSFSV